MKLLSLILVQLGFISFSPYISDFKMVAFVKERVPEFTGNDSLATTEIGNDSRIQFTYPVNAVTLIMQPCDSLSEGDEWYCPEPVYSRNWRVAEWNESFSQAGFTIYFSPGPSEDPEFIFIDHTGKRLGYIAGLKLEIHSDQIIYASGHSNTMYNKKRMYIIEVDTILEISQPFYHVGQKGNLLRNIDVFSDESLKQKQQQINQGEEIEIVFALSGGKDESFEKIYLIKTNAGIMGYIRIENEDSYGALMEGFFYAGD